MNRKWLPALGGVVMLALLMTACGGEPDLAGVTVVETVVVEQVVTERVPAQVSFQSERLDAVKASGQVRCGINAGQPGFGYQSDGGEFVGFDVDFCRALAVAIFNNPDAVAYQPVTLSGGFGGLQADDIDVLIRNAGWTLTRDTQLAVDFGPVIFYDVQTVMVPAESGITSLEGLDGATICVIDGSIAEASLADAFAVRGLSYTPLLFENAPSAAGAYGEGLCTGFAAGRAELAGHRTQLADPNAHIILPETLAVAPLAPVVAHGDQAWLDVVTWVVNGVILAEELGVRSDNVDALLANSPPDPNVRRLLGLEGNLGASMGLTNDFMPNVIRQVGNYGEIYDRHLTPIGLERAGTLNDLYTRGGILFAPMMR